MWSRPPIKTKTRDRYRDYALKHGLKLWRVFDLAIECLEEKK